MNRYLAQIDAASDAYDGNNSLKKVLRAMIKALNGIEQQNVPEGLSWSDNYTSIYYKERRYDNEKDIMTTAFKYLCPSSHFYNFQLANTKYEDEKYIYDDSLPEVSLVSKLNICDPYNKILLDVAIRDKIIYANGVIGHVKYICPNATKMLILNKMIHSDETLIQYVSQFSNLQIFVYRCELESDIVHMIKQNNQGIKLIKGDKTIYYLANNLQKYYNAFINMKQIAKYYMFVDKPRFGNTKNARSA